MRKKTVVTYSQSFVDGDNSVVVNKEDRTVLLNDQLVIHEDDLPKIVSMLKACKFPKK